MSTVERKNLTPQEFEEVVTEVTLGMDDALTFEEDHGAYEEVVTESTVMGQSFVDMMEEVAQQIAAENQQATGTKAAVEENGSAATETVQVAGTEEEVQEAVDQGKSLGERMGEFLAKFPKTVKVFNSMPREKQFAYARSVIEGLYLQGKHLSVTIGLTDEFMELDEREESGKPNEKALVQIIKMIAIKVIAVTVGLVVETVFFTLDVVLESAACLTRVASHVVFELGYTGQQITKSFKRHYLNR